MTSEDLRMYSVKVKHPLNISIDDGQATMYAAPPPSSGVILGLILKILDGAETAHEKKGLHHRIYDK